MIITPANRLTETKQYYFASKLKEIADMRAAGKQVINLGIGNPDLPPHKSVVETLYTESKKADQHGYGSYKGEPDFLIAVAKWYSKYYNVTLNPSADLLPLFGSKEGIMLISWAFLNPGDQVLIPDPGYPAYNAVTKLVEATPVTYNLKYENNWQPDFDELEAMDLSRVKIMWVNYPHMPTGAKANADTFTKLVAFAKKHQILLVNDNPYSFILNKKPMSILQTEGAIDVCLELNSLSKSHNMAGWRVGTLAGKPAYLDAVMKVKSNMSSGMHKPTLLASAKALQLPQSWYNSMNEVYTERKNNAYKIARLLNCEIDENAVGMFVWCKLPDEAETAEIFADRILHEAGVFITPGFIFGKNGERFIRISLANTAKDLDASAKKIEHALGAIMA